MIYLLLILLIVNLFLLCKLRIMKLDRQKIIEKLELIKSEHQKLINDPEIWEQFGCRKELKTIMNEADGTRTISVLVVLTIIKSIY